MYRYIERFHPKIDSKSDSTISSSQISPSVPIERRREIIYLANQIEDFKKRMEKIKEGLPQRVFDKNDSTEKFPRNDVNLINLENYESYKAFKSIEGIPDFSDLTKNDVALICDTFTTEVQSFYKFWYAWNRLISLANYYSTSPEVNRICAASKR